MIAPASVVAVVSRGRDLWGCDTVSADAVLAWLQFEHGCSLRDAAIALEKAEAARMVYREGDELGLEPLLGVYVGRAGRTRAAAERGPGASSAVAAPRFFTVAEIATGALAAALAGALAVGLLRLGGVL